MRRFLEANEGLTRRFGLSFDFPDFSIDELAQMFTMKTSHHGFRLGEGVTIEAVGGLLEKYTHAEFRSKTNGGIAERLARGAMRMQDARLDPMRVTRSQYKAQASMINLCDVQGAAQLLVPEGS